MIVTFQFNLPEEKTDYLITSQALDLHSAIWEFDQWLRGIVKYGNSDLKELDYQQVTQLIRDRLREEMEDRAVTLVGS